MSESNYPIGEPVTIGGEGNFASLRGVIKAIELSKRRVMVDLNLFGRTTPIEFDMESVLIDGNPLLEHLRTSNSPHSPPLIAPPPPANEQFERLLCENPRDDETRSIYADWLEEQGDPHAEYLRLQVELYRTLLIGLPVESLLKQEADLRNRLDPDWINRVRRLTTRPPSVDLSDLSTDLSIQARPSIRMHPRVGSVPELDASKLGGVFLWPESEPWPVWESFQPSEQFHEIVGDNMVGGIPAAGTDIPMAPVVQLHRRDFPVIDYPEGMDLLQLFWLPMLDSYAGPRPRIFWRDSNAVQQPRREGPTLTHYQKNCVPGECRLHPEEVLEYPFSSMCDQYECDLAHADRIQQLASRLERPEADVHSEYVESWAALQGNKVGGFSVTTQHSLPLEHGGEQWEFLLSLSSRELNRNAPRALPLEDEDLSGEAFLDRLLGTTTRFARGDYFVLVQKNASPWKVRSFADYT